MFDFIKLLHHTNVNYYVSTTNTANRLVVVAAKSPFILLIVTPQSLILIYSNFLSTLCREISFVASFTDIVSFRHLDVI